MKKTKILTIISSLPNSGGVATVAYSLNSELNKSDIFVNDIITVRLYDGFFKRTIKKILKKNVMVREEGNNQIIWIPNTFFKKNKTKQIEKNINVLDYDIIHAHFYKDWGKEAIFIAKKNNKKSVITFHGSDTINITKDDIDYLNQADYITYVSNFLKNKVESVGSISVKQKIIYNGYNSEIFKLKNISNSRNIIAYCGSLVDVKGVDALQSIFQNLHKLDVEKKLKFHIYGDGPKKQQLFDFFNSNNINVEFFGNLNQNDLADKLQEVKVLIVPSKAEGYGCIVIEAKACGVYVIAANVGGLPEAIGNLGSLVERDNKFEIEVANEVMNIVENENLNAELISSDKLISWNQVINDYEKVYHELMMEEENENN